MQRLMGTILLFGVMTKVLAGGFDARTSWFKPVLAEDNDPVCKSLLGDVQKKFFSDISFNEAYGVQGHGYAKSGQILNWNIEIGLGTGEITAYGKTFYLGYQRNPGCGGACETNQPLVSDKATTLIGIR